MKTSNDVIGFAGIGAMGTPMAGKLASAGYKVVVFDLDATRTEKLAGEQGVAVAASLAELGAAADIIITMLPDGKAVRSALCGDNDSFKSCILERAKKNTLVIDMSSSSPMGTRELGDVLAKRGLQFIDAPVSNGVKGAVAATLSIMVGGDHAISFRWHVGTRCRFHLLGRYRRAKRLEPCAERIRDGGNPRCRHQRQVLATQCAVMPHEARFDC